MFFRNTLSYLIKCKRVVINHTFWKYYLVDLRDISKNLKAKQTLRQRIIKKQKKIQH
jgi:hypothetical protein